MSWGHALSRRVSRLAIPPQTSKTDSKVIIQTAPPAIHTLAEIHKYCPEILSRLEILVDGGIRRGTDVVKALCFGAKGVGIGRAALFGLGAGGVAGVERTLESKKLKKKFGVC